MPRFETIIKITHVEPNNIYPNSSESLKVECPDLGLSESYSYKLKEGPTGRQEFIKDTLKKLAETLSTRY